MADNAVDNPECGSLQSLSNECFSLHRFSSQVRSPPSSWTLNIVVVSVLFSNFHTWISHFHTLLFQFYRSDGVVHVHVWLCEAVQPAPILKTANSLLHNRDCPRIHTQVSRSPTRSWCLRRPSCQRSPLFSFCGIHIIMCIYLPNHILQHNIINHILYHKLYYQVILQHYSGELCCDMHVGRGLVSIISY